MPGATPCIKPSYWPPGSARGADSGRERQILSKPTFFLKKSIPFGVWGVRGAAGRRRDSFAPHLALRIIYKQWYMEAILCLLIIVLRAKDNGIWRELLGSGEGLGGCSGRHLGAVNPTEL